MVKRTLTMEVTDKDLVVGESFVFDRSDPNELYCIKLEPKREEVTRIQSLREGNWHRNDIGMVNLYLKGRDGKPNRISHPDLPIQLCVYPTMDGQTTKGEAWKWFTKAEKEQLIEINRKILEAVKDYPEMISYISTS